MRRALSATFTILSASAQNEKSDRDRAVPAFYPRKHMARNTPTWIPALLIALTAATALHAERHALLIGIGAYSAASQLPELAGPPSDLDSMKDLLRRMGFTDIVELRGPQATRLGILAALNQVRARVRSGDYVVFYYSGHGTSYGDPNANTWGLDANTGALLPYDIRLGEGPQVAAQLIVGKRDLRPVFSEIDKVATLFAIFDTCYSADAAKSAAKPVATRYIPPYLLTRSAGAAKGDLDAATANVVQHQDTTPFPYQHVISLAAAGKFQQAMDMPASESFDHKPHGMFTDSLLRGMSGDADKNHDGRITTDELFNFLQERAVHWSHQPVLQAGPGISLGMPAFDVAAILAPGSTGSGAPPAVSGKVLVKTEGLDPAMIGRINGLARVAVWQGSGPFDLFVKRVSGGYDLFDSSLVAISNDSLSAQDLLNRIAAQPQVRDLLETSYTQQFNVALRMKPDDQSAWFAGQNFRFSARTDREAYLLLLNIDVTGAITVVYPFQQAATVTTKAGLFLPLGGDDPVVEPFGVEYMKLFAFTSKPADFDHWNMPPDAREAKTVVPGTPEFERLLRMLQSNKEGRAETALRLITVARPNTH